MAKKIWRRGANIVGQTYEVREALKDTARSLGVGITWSSDQKCWVTGSAADATRILDALLLPPEYEILKDKPGGSAA